MSQRNQSTYSASNPTDPISYSMGSIAHACAEFSDENRYVINSGALLDLLDHPNLLVVDLRPAEHGAEGYIPGSLHLNYNRLIRRHGHAEGLLPRVEDVRALFSELGVKPWHFVVAYDDETGVEAARFLWTLEVAGHHNYALLDGGFADWKGRNLHTIDFTRYPAPTDYPEFLPGPAAVNKQYVLDAIGSEDICIIDTRTIDEYRGEDVRAQRGGHLPGAIHFDWTNAVDLYGNGLLRDPQNLRTQLEKLGVGTDKEIILYCQSNRRCAHTFVVFKWLGYPNVKTYHGAWSEWGNDPDTPIAH